MLLETFLLLPTDKTYTHISAGHTHAGTGLLGTFGFKRHCKQASQCCYELANALMGMMD